ncbi:MAG: UDP-N-acetylglucosamine--LPS N-acetylglucosamine transferase [Symploca sp. SIO2B6]|nr:UDP-N-acetylglucosamine--LPS N-acetylglucosamine transferase [Symploca sp. SIO2B6]
MKLMLVCTSGGHFSTMRGLKQFWSQHERVWVTDLKQDTQMIAGKEKVYWLPYQAPRDLFAIVKNFPATMRILRQEQPAMVICTGASLAINFAIAAKLTRHKFIYIESISRSKDLSISGKIVYPIADEFYVQWQQLTAKYPKALFKGTVTASVTPAYSSKVA